MACAKSKSSVLPASAVYLFDLISLTKALSRRESTILSQLLKGTRRAGLWDRYYDTNYNSKSNYPKILIRTVTPLL